jgi:DNA invertase Pin-like site-specific DNA recombinase
VITQINIAAISVPRLKRVAAYTRVSSGKDAMLQSLSAQVSYYSELIQNHKDWEYVGIYSDEALTGTKENRPQFIRLLNDCRQGKVDMVITKSISRFARNTVTLLTTVRELKGYGIDVYFEEQNIHTMSSDGELMLTILASYAQEESLSVSENCKWRIRNKYKEGIPNTFSVFGYSVSGKKLEINEQEAPIVRIIFDEYLKGLGKLAIAKKLNADGIRTKNDREWSSDKVREILRNEKYAGDLLLQKVFISSHLEKKNCKNDGILPKYYISSNHEAIIDREAFDAVQDEMNRRKKNYSTKPTSNIYPFTSKIICSHCGKYYHRKINNAGTKYQKAIWICSTYNTMGKSYCDAKQIPESVLEELRTELNKEIRQIIALENKKLKFIFLDNTEVEKEWNY